MRSCFSKLLMRMLRLVCLMCVVFVTSAQASVIAQKKLTMHLGETGIKQVFEEIQRQTGCMVMYNDDRLDLRKSVKANFENISLEELLANVLSGSGMNYKFVDDYIVIVPSMEVDVPQSVESRIVKGVVTDKGHVPLPGVTVVVKGTQLGTATDVDGRFSIQLPGIKDVVLIFSFVGMETLEVKPGEKNDLKIVLNAAAVEMEDVVVTGIYQRKKESFTGSSTTFKSEELKAVGTNNVIQSLRTLDPSFKIVENNQFGSDPNQMPDIEIRGKSSVVGLKEEYGTDPNQPLFILDGFETTLETIMNLNMNRVASVTLLKDAASTAIYGSKASNGVVVIETKAPERGRLQLSYKGDFSVTMADLSDYNLMNSHEKLQFETLAGVYKDLTNNPLNQIRLDSLRNARLKGIEQGIDTYWLSEPLQTGFTHKHNIYAEGGEENVRYGIGLSYGKVRGVMKGSDRQTISEILI